MKLSIFSSTLLLAVSVSAGSLFQQQSLGLGSDIEAVAMAGLKKVPGENPLYFCGDTSEDIASIETVDLLPNPPVPGHTLVINAVGFLKDAITQGAKVEIFVKYGLITMFKQTADICDNADQVDLECPVNRGKLILNKSVDLPNQIPPGVYTVVANAYTADGRPIVCLTAIVKFTIGGKSHPF